VLRVFGAIPGFTGIAFLVAAVWMFIAAVIAVRQALDYTSTVRAAGVCVPGWLVHVFLLFFLIVAWLGGYAARVLRCFSHNERLTIRMRA
jgi:predicted branched-subunit amino acid permease